MDAPFKILIADDEEAVRNLLKIVLGTQNFEILLAENGREAVDIFSQTPTDAVLMDLNMPQMDGCEAIGLIRKLPGGKDIPIVVLTALDIDDWEQKAKESGATIYLTKPFSTKGVIHCFRTILESLPKPSEPQKSKSKGKIPHIKVQYQTKEGFKNCFLRNLLSNQSFIETENLLPLGSRFNFEIIPPLGADPFTVTGTVKWLNLYEEQKGMGVEFSYQNPEDENRVQDLVKTLESTEMQLRSRPK